MKTLKLWPDGKVPGSLGNKDADVPDITAYPVSEGRATGAAVLICPGGGYGCLCSSYEGHDIAKWLNGYGIAGIVLKYRIAPYRHPIPLNDAKRAMRLAKANAKEWGFSADRVGVMGFSAGGHLASTLATHCDSGSASGDAIERQGCRPAFQILVYPVISGAKGHSGSMKNLLGENPDETALKDVANDLHVTKETPPAFLAHSTKDKVVSFENSVAYRDALKAHGVPVEYFELDTGDHGLGCGKGSEWAAWQAECVKWLRAMKLAD